MGSVYVCRINDTPTGSRPSESPDVSFFQRFKVSGAVPFTSVMQLGGNHSKSSWFAEVPRWTPRQEKQDCLNSCGDTAKKRISDVNVKKDWIVAQTKCRFSLIVRLSSFLPFFSPSILPSFNIPCQPCFYTILFFLLPPFFSCPSLLLKNEIHVRHLYPHKPTVISGSLNL